MNAPTLGSPPATSHHLRFQSLFHEGRAYAFPCDANGCVDLDSLGRKALDNYLYARTVIGREFAMPDILLDGGSAAGPHS